MTRSSAMLYPSRSWLPGLFVLLLLFAGIVKAKDYGDIQQQRIHHVLSQTDAISEPDGPFKVRKLSLIHISEPTRPY